MFESSLLILGYWLLFFRYAYWITFSYQTKKINKKVFLAYILEGSILFGLFREFFSGKVPFSFLHTNVYLIVGFFSILFGVCLCFLAHKQLGDSWTHAASIKAKTLVTKGIYSSIRHPIYTGLILSYVGSQILVGSWLWISCLFLFIPAYLQAKKEEILLEKKFGQTFISYKKKTNMFVPFLF